jgi:hypothetical protein
MCSRLTRNGDDWKVVYWSGFVLSKKAKNGFDYISRHGNIMHVVLMQLRQLLREYGTILKGVQPWKTG